MFIGLGKKREAGCLFSGEAAGNPDSELAVRRDIKIRVD